MAVKNKWLFGVLLCVAGLVLCGVILFVVMGHRAWCTFMTGEQLVALTCCAADYLDENPTATPAEIERGMREHYTKRTGLDVPLDGWGGTITFEVAVEDDVCRIFFRTPGADGKSGTRDDLRGKMKVG